ncbi:MAG: hypothetical protein ABEK84_10625 [Salinibacter sp.]
MNFTTLRTALVWGVALSFLVLLPSCDSIRPDLDVENKNQPSRAQVLGTPADVEGIASGLWRNYWGTYQSWGYAPLLETMADTYSCNWANYGMNRMSSQPRVKWKNSSAYAYANSTEGPWFDGYTVISNAADILKSIDRLGKSEFKAEGVNVNRLKAFSNFMMGLVYGKIAANFDRAFLVDGNTNLEAVATGQKELKLQKYGKVTDFSLKKLNKAIQFAKQGSFEIPPTWIWGLTITDQQLVYLANSFKARIAAMTARTPKERMDLGHSQMASWSKVKTWIENGLEATGYSGQFRARTVEYTCRDINCPNAFNIPNTRKKTTPAGFAPISRGGFGTSGIDVLKWMSTQSNTWARADYRMIGPADVSNDKDDCVGAAGNDGSGDDGEISCYQEWQNTPVADRLPYVTETTDRRIQGPKGPKDHGTFFDFVGTALTAFPPARGTYHYSDRTFVRYQYHPENQGPSAGEPMTYLTKPEMDLLKAEAILHMNGNTSTVAKLINNTRDENGKLPKATGDTPVGSIQDAPDPLPGYPGGKPSLWSMLKYEFHIETMSTASGLNFYARRGWGDLIKGTPLHFPIPERELNTLQKQVYTFGGVGGRCSAGNPTNCFGGSGGGSSSSLSGVNKSMLKTFLGRRPPVRSNAKGQVK